MARCQDESLNASVDIEDILETIWARLGGAERAPASVNEKWFEIAGLTFGAISWQCARPYIAPALAHLQIDRLNARRNSRCIAGIVPRSVDFPKAPVSMEAFTPRGEVRGLNNRRFHASFRMEASN